MSTKSGFRFSEITAALAIMVTFVNKYQNVTDENSRPYSSPGYSPVKLSDIGNICMEYERTPNGHMETTTFELSVRHLQVSVSREDVGIGQPNYFLRQIVVIDSDWGKKEKKVFSQEEVAAMIGKDALRNAIFVPA